jgi:hypothetical protein
MPTTDHSPEPETSPHNHWALLRDLLAFQVKLGLDGLRDLALIPVSIVAFIAGVIVHPSTPGIYFYKLLSLGRQSDRWINLFGEHHSDHSQADNYVSKVETAVVNQYQKGGLVKQITDRTDEVISNLQQSTGNDEDRDKRS